MAGILGKEYTFLRSSITATHNKYFLAGEELSITSCAISYAPSFKPFLPLKSDHSRMCSGCEQNSITRKVALICMHDFIFSIYIQLFNLCHQEFCTKILCLSVHSSGQGFSICFLYSRIVHHLFCDRDLSTNLLFLDNKHPVTGSRQINSCCKPRRSRACNHHIIHIFILHSYNLPTRSRLGRSVASPGCHLAGQTSSPCSATNWHACNLRNSSSAFRPTLPALTS